jgi:ParB-like chromosome segregation protein Spo0J
MTSRRSPPVERMFEDTTLRIQLANILPIKVLTLSIVNSIKYSQVAASINEIGIIEPPVVIRCRGEENKFTLLDGHIRLHILRKRGDQEVVCLVAKEDEAFTYNKRINRLTIVQEHKMILRAVERGVPEERLARALNVDVSNIRKKRALLDGVCAEAAEMIKHKSVPINTVVLLKKLKPMRQIEAVELMVAMNRFTTAYARSLVAATPASQLVESKKPTKGLSAEQIAMMENESAQLEREFRTIEQDYGSDHLDLVLAIGYISKLLGSVRVVRYLASQYADVLEEFQKIVDLQKAA